MYTSRQDKHSSQTSLPVSTVVQSILFQTHAVTSCQNYRRSRMYDLVRYNLVPPLFLVFFTGITQWLVAAGIPNRWFRAFRSLVIYLFLFSHFRQFSLATLLSPGSFFSWTVVFIFLLWSFLSLKVPARIFKGPATPAGYIPAYSANGVQYYFLSLAAYLALVFTVPSLPVSIWHQFDQIISSLNIFSLVLCTWLLFKGLFTSFKSLYTTLVPRSQLSWGNRRS